MEETISLEQLTRVLKRRGALIAIIIAIAITISGVFSLVFLTPIYQADTQILVNQEKTEQLPFSAQDIQTNLQFINTYNVIIKSPAILSKVIDELNLETTVSALNQKISVNNVQNSQVVTIAVQDSNPRRAVEIANKTATVFQKEIVSLMKVDNVSILAEAEMAEKPSPIKPNPKLNMVIGAILGLMIGVGMAFLLEYLDTTITKESDVEEILGLPILGLISPIPDKELNNARVEITQRRRRK